MVKTVDVATLKQWLKNNEVVLIDVREPGEYEESKIEGAHLIPLGQITLEEVKKLNEEGKKIAVHCRSGKRSMAACELLLKQESGLQIYNVEGGILAWNNN